MRHRLTLMAGFLALLAPPFVRASGPCHLPVRLASGANPLESAKSILRERFRDANRSLPSVVAQTDGRLRTHYQTELAAQIMVGIFGEEFLVPAEMTLEEAVSYRLWRQPELVVELFRYIPILSILIENEVAPYYFNKSAYTARLQEMGLFFAERFAKEIREERSPAGMEEFLDWWKSELSQYYDLQAKRSTEPTPFRRIAESRIPPAARSQLELVLPTVEAWIVKEAFRISELSGQSPQEVQGHLWEPVALELIRILKISSIEVDRLPFPRQRHQFILGITHSLETNGALSEIEDRSIRSIFQREKHRLAMSPNVTESQMERAFVDVYRWSHRAAFSVTNDPAERSEMMDRILKRLGFDQRRQGLLLRDAVEEEVKKGTQEQMLGNAVLRRLLPDLSFVKKRASDPALNELIQRRGDLSPGVAALTEHTLTSYLNRLYRRAQFVASDTPSGPERSRVTANLRSSYWEGSRDDYLYALQIYSLAAHSAPTEEELSAIFDWSVARVLERPQFDVTWAPWNPEDEGWIVRYYNEWPQRPSQTDFHFTHEFRIKTRGRAPHAKKGSNSTDTLPEREPKHGPEPDLKVEAVAPASLTPILDSNPKPKSTPRQASKPRKSSPKPGKVNSDEVERILLEAFPESQRDQLATEMPDFISHLTATLYGQDSNKGRQQLLEILAKQNGNFLRSLTGSAREDANVWLDQYNLMLNADGEIVQRSGW